MITSEYPIHSRYYQRTTIWCLFDSHKDSSPSFSFHTRGALLQLFMQSLKRPPPDPILRQFFSSLPADVVFLPGSVSSGPARLALDGPLVFTDPSLLRSMFFLQGCLLTYAQQTTTPSESSLIIVTAVCVFRDSSEVVIAYLIWPSDVNYIYEQSTLQCIHFIDHAVRSS